MRVVVVTGLSGGGKSTALRALEDIGFYVVDNMPLPMVAQLVELVAGTEGAGDVAISVDARQHWFLPQLRPTVESLRKAGHQVEVLYLEASDEVLLRRYSENRRRHPLAGDDLPDGIRRDREALSELRHGAAVVNTGSLNVHQLKGIVHERYGKRDGVLAVTMLSFGFKHGLPPESDLAFDVRFLPNPYFREELSGSDGTNAAVSDFVFDTDNGQGAELLDRLEGLLRFSLPQYEREGKLYLTISVGCTGGRHRSVAVVEELAKRLGDEWDIHVRHRDLGQGA